MKIIPLLLLLIIAFSCGTEKKIAQERPEKEQNDYYQFSATFGSKNEISSDIFTIKSAKIEKNTLFLEVTISGECIQHAFRMFGFPGPINALQATRNIQLIHFANNDICTRSIDVPLEINISELAIKKEKGAKTMLKLEGWKFDLEYIFYTSD